MNRLFCFQGFILTYSKYLEDCDLMKFEEESTFYKLDLCYLLQHIPKITIDNEDEDDLQTDIILTVFDIIGKCIKMCKQQVPSEARTLILNALTIQEYSSILLRLVSKYIYEANPSAIELALKYAKMAVLSCSGLLEHPFHYASLLCTK